MGILQTQFFTHQRENGTVQHLIFQVQRYGWLLATAEVVDVMTATYRQGVLEQAALHGTGMLYLVHDTHINLLPETGYGRHTGGMCLAHRLLHLLWMRVDNHPCSGIQTEDSPSTFENVRIGQEVHDAVILVDRHTLAISNHGSMELAVRQDDTLRIARSTTGI